MKISNEGRAGGDGVRDAMDEFVEFADDGVCGCCDCVGGAGLLVADDTRESV